MSEDPKTEILERPEILNLLRELISLSQRYSSAGDSTVPSADAMSKALHKVSSLAPELTRKVTKLLDEREGLSTLADIEKRIASSLNTNEILELVLDAIVRLTNAERSILLLTDENGESKVEVGRNQKQQNISDEDKAFSTSIIKQVIRNGTPILTTNAAEDPRFSQNESVMFFSLRSIMCVPLINQEGIIGAIYADHRNFSNQFSFSKLEMLNRFANQAAIALHNAAIYEDLEEAYYSTLVGWAKALELRDENTEGHTQRVTELTLRLAEEIGIDGVELVKIQRGAILHDIGKMGIPDAILNKPGKLTEEEREIMCQHPELAMQMISKISFLENASDIPHHHHEKWDGSGYPDGLKAEDIPLAARIFAVVDVWDALTSDRPYRPALEKGAVLAFLRTQSGTHFDPTILDKFIELVEAGKL